MGTDEDDLLKLVEERDHYEAEMEKYWHYSFFIGARKISSLELGSKIVGKFPPKKSKTEFCLFLEVSDKMDPPPFFWPSVDFFWPRNKKKRIHTISWLGRFCPSVIPRVRDWGSGHHGLTIGEAPCPT